MEVRSRLKKGGCDYRRGRNCEGGCNASTRKDRERDGAGAVNNENGIVRFVAVLELGLRQERDGVRAGPRAD